MVGVIGKIKMARDWFGRICVVLFWDVSRCLQHKVIPKGFRSNFHASIFSNVSNFNLKYLHEIQLTQNTFSRNIMRSTIRVMCSKRNELNKQIIECRSQLSNVCPSVLLRSIHTKIQFLNSKLNTCFLYHHSFHSNATKT